MAHEVRLRVGERIVDRIADARLRREMDDGVSLHRALGGFQRGMIGDVQVMEAETGPPGQLGEAVGLECDRVVIIEAVHAGDGDTGVQQRAGHVESDETGRAGEKDVLWPVSAHWLAYPCNLSRI